MKKTTVTLKDVAREAGFSVMTVSHILNGNKLSHASPESRERIVAAARKLDYRPNLAARQLVTKRSNRIGLLIDSCSPMFYRDVMVGLEPPTSQADYRLQVGFVHNRLDSLRQYVEDFKSSGIDSVICLAHTYPDFGDRVVEMLDDFEHVVYLEKPLTPTRFPAISTDPRSNYYKAVSELLRRGYRRIFSIRSNYRDYSYVESERGIRDAYRDAGVDFDEVFWWEGQDWWHDPATAEHEIRRLLPLEPEVLILGNDESMSQALRVLHSLGKRVPEDIALFSAELYPMFRSAMPSFSGFNYNAPILARRMAERLFRDIEAADQSADSVEHIPADIVWGESCRERIRNPKERP